MESLPEENNVLNVINSCCDRGWFHIECVQKHAVSSGYNFGCIMCRNKDFINLARSSGIYVPEKYKNTYFPI